MSEYNTRHEDDWSGRHVRIRFEMILSAVVFFIVARYGSDEVRLPIIGLQSEIKDGFLMWASLAFTVFSGVSLLTRSYYEKMLWPKEELSTRKEIDTFSSDFESLSQTALELEFTDKENIADTFKQLGGEYEQIKLLNLKTNRFLQFLSDLFHENGMNSPVHPKFWAKVVPLMATVNDSSNKLSSFSDLAKNTKGNIRATGSTHEAIHDDTTREYRQLIDSLGALKPEIEERRRALKQLAFTKLLQREVLSYGLPMLTALVLVLFGLASKFCGCL